VGPVLVTSLATLVEPVAGLAAAILAGVGGTVALVLQRRTEPPPARHLGAHGVGPMGWPVLGPLALSMFTLGALFGGAEVTAVAVSASLGHKGYSGALLAIWSLGSLVAGVVVGALPVRAANGTRYRWGLLTLGLLLTPLPFVHGFGLLGVFLLLAGFAIAPTLIASIALVEETVPPGRLNEGISIVTTGLNAGLAPGAAVAGAVIDRAGASAAFWVSSGAGLLGAAIAFGAEPVMRLSRRAPSPSGSSE
jgi:MFS family permease